MDHVDLKANILLPGKDLVGSSFNNMQEDNDPDAKSDSTDHGFRVSGMAPAVSNNGMGIASLAFNTRLTYGTPKSVKKNFSHRDYFTIQLVSVTGLWVQEIFI